MVTYYATDLISDILALGNSSRLYSRLVKETQLFSSIDAYITADIDPGLFIISGKINKGVKVEEAEQALEEELINLKETVVPHEELMKVKNKVQTAHVYGKISVLNKAMGLGIASFISSPDLINKELFEYDKVDSGSIQRVASNLFNEDNCSTLYYLSKK